MVFPPGLARRLERRTEREGAKGLAAAGRRLRVACGARSMRERCARLPAARRPQRIHSERSSPAERSIATLALAEPSAVAPAPPSAMDHDEDRSLSLGTEVSTSVPPPSPLTGCYLLAVIGEPHTHEHKEIILQRLVKVLSTEVDDGEPYLHIMARSTVYNTGERKAIYCKGRNLAEDIKWYTPSNKVVEARSTKNPRVYVEKTNDHGMVALMIQYIKIQDSGNWTCKSGNHSENIEFFVGEKANIAERNVDLLGDEGKSIKLTCEAKGYPTPVVVWYKADTSPPTPIHEDPTKYIIRADNSLEIKNLNHADVAPYVCKVRQKALSHYTDKTVHLAVQHKPIMYNQLTKATMYKTEEVYAIINETKNITCSAIANPQPTYFWFRRPKNGEDIPITDPDMFYTSEDGSFSILKLMIHDDSDIGQYMCLANNTKGQESIIFDVGLGDKPNPPDYVTLYSANASSLTFNVTCYSCPTELSEFIVDNPMNLTIKGFSFQLVPVVAEFDADWEKATTFNVNIDTPNNTLYTVGPLTNTTKYHARIASINAAGLSEWLVITPNPETTSLATSIINSLILLFACIYACY